VKSFLKFYIVAQLLFIVAPPTRADADIKSTESIVSVTFIANPNLPKPPAPGLPPNGNPVQGQIQASSLKGKLPKTGESQSNLVVLGFTIMLVALLLFISKKKKFNSYSQNTPKFFN